MLDSPIRQGLHQPLDTIASWFERRGISPNQLTAVGFVVGVAACVAVAADRWIVGLVMWLLNRLIDGLDGSVARRVGPTKLGGFLDIMADFAIYGGIVVAIGWAAPEARLAALVVFLMYYLNGSAFLAWSSLANDLDVEGDGRSLNFPAGLAEGTETIVMMCLVLLARGYTEVLLWVWAGVVAISVLQRIRFVAISLAGDRTSREDPTPGS